MRDIKDNLQVVTLDNNGMKSAPNLKAKILGDKIKEDLKTKQLLKESLVIKILNDRMLSVRDYAIRNGERETGDKTLYGLAHNQANQTFLIYQTKIKVKGRFYKIKDILLSTKHSEDNDKNIILTFPDETCLYFIDKKHLMIEDDYKLLLKGA